jgi:acetoin utilization deacetylase AcuC-like enzyme
MNTGSNGAQMLMVDQRGERGGAVPWILDARGRRVCGHDDGRRMAAVRSGLLRQRGVSARTADASPAEVERVLRRLHEPGYLDALERVRGSEPVLVAELAQPGIAPDTPVCAQAVAAAREGVGVAIVAARGIVAGARFSYALCRPPGHHAGPGWLGGYCYLNNAAAAAQTLHDGGVARVGILDLDLHYPNGTAALLEHMAGTTLHSLHGATGANLPWARVRARGEREHLVAFRSPPSAETYLAAVAACVETLSRTADAIVLSLGYDLVAGDPHGSWRFDAAIFAQVGQLLARAGLPVCVVQEGGYALSSLASCSHAFAAGLLDEGVRPAPASPGSTGTFVGSQA